MSASLSFATPPIRTDTLEHAAEDLSAALARDPSIYAVYNLEDGWRIGTHHVTADGGTIYVGHLLAVRDNELRALVPQRAVGPDRERRLRCLRDVLDDAERSRNGLSSLAVAALRWALTELGGERL